LMGAGSSAANVRHFMRALSQVLTGYR
jgi:hypothetical protein